MSKITWVPVFVEQAICDLIPDEGYARENARLAWLWDDEHPNHKKERILELFPGAVEMPDASGVPSADYCIVRPATKKDWPENMWVEIGPYVSGNPWDAAAKKWFPLPCPFCGELPEEVHDNDKTYFYVACDNNDCPCQPETGLQISEEKARSEWNERR